MEIVFGVTQSEYNAIHKTMTERITLTGTLRNESPISNPVIMVETGENIVTKSYAYIPEFKRYYFIVECVSVRNGLWRVTMKTDVLTSFYEGIMASSGIILETAGYGSCNYLPNDVWCATVKDKTDIITFPSGFNDTGEYILITAGGLPS